jgi:hypothetical protein
LAGGLNSYGFAAGDPVTYSDPYGLSAQDGPCDPPGSCETTGAAVGAVIGGAVGVVVASGCAESTLGICALAAPGIVHFFAGGGAAFGALVGVLTEAASSNDEDDARHTPGPPTEIPATGLRVTRGQGRQIQEMGEAHGCHECGATNPSGNGTWIGDHVPASALNPDGEPQVLKPHCHPCSNSQGGRVRAQVRRNASGGYPVP